MDVFRFDHHYELAAPLFDLTPDQLADRDRQRSETIRWLATSDDSALAALDVTIRPDRKAFLGFRGNERHAWRPLADAAKATMGRPMYATVDANDLEAVHALQAAGFAPDLVLDKFRVRFEDALGVLRRAWIPTNVSIHPADGVDEEKLFALDNTLRQDVPGIDGWQGNRVWFREEMEEAPPFDPTGYLVAIDDRSGAYIGLCRMWRNPDGPRLGLIGVVRPYRKTTIAGALLHRTLRAAAGWGWDTFTTEASTSNRQTHPRLVRIADELIGRSLQLVRS